MNSRRSEIYHVSTTVKCNPTGQLDKLVNTAYYCTCDQLSVMGERGFQPLLTQTAPVCRKACPEFAEGPVERTAA